MDGLSGKILIIDKGVSIIMDPFRKYIEKLATPGRDKAIDYMCDRFNQYYGGDLISREDIKITDYEF